MSHPNKAKQRENRRKGRLDVRLDKKNVFGKIDFTPWKAINNICNK